MHGEFVAAVRSAGPIGLTTPWGAIGRGTVTTTHNVILMDKDTGYSALGRLRFS